MNEKRANLEIIAPSIEDAIAKGLSDLGLPEEAVDVEVLDEGSRGLFGIGMRQARIRMVIKDRPPEEAAPLEETPSSMFDEPAPEAAPEPESGLDETSQRTLTAARETVEDLLERMGVDAGVTATYGEPDDDRSRVPLLVDIHGDDLSILIGPRAETLNALQYITSLIVGKEMGHSVLLVVDVEGYRVRRTQQLRRLAETMASQAVKTGRRQSLEPMTARERRLVHIALRDHPEVYTESVGEDPRRKVTVIPKE